MPRKDSVTTTVVLAAHALDRAQDLPDWFQEDIARAVRSNIQIPRPFQIAAYETDWEEPTRTAHPAVRTVIRAVLSNDGHIRGAHVTGGVRNDALDRAVISALQLIDSTGALKGSASEALGAAETPVVLSVTASIPPSPGETGRHMRKEYGITVSAGADDPPNWAGPPAADSAEGFPLFSFRTPLLAVTRIARLIPGAGGLRYPDRLRRAKLDGSADIAVVVGADGRTENGTALLVRATRPEFLQAVLNALSSFRFEPLQVEGCAVRSLEQIPFRFLIAH